MPGQKYTFGLVKAAQARGDFQVLAERNRRALRIHIGADVAAGPAHARRGDRQGAGVVARTPAASEITRALYQQKDSEHAARNDRSRPDGREHGAASDAGWPHLRRSGRLGRRRRRAREGRRDRLLVDRGFPEQAVEAASGLPDGARGHRGLDHRQARAAPGPGRHDHRRRQFALPRRHRAREAAAAEGASTTSTWARAAASGASSAATA